MKRCVAIVHGAPGRGMRTMIASAMPALRYQVFSRRNASDASPRTKIARPNASELDSPLDSESSGEKKIFAIVSRPIPVGTQGKTIWRVVESAVALGFGKENASAVIKAMEKEAGVDVNARSAS